MSQLLQYYRSFHNRNEVSNSTPTFEDLSIDPSLTEIQRLEKYVKSSIALQRLVQVKIIYEVAVQIGFQSTKVKIIPLLESLSKDTESAVKIHLVEQFVYLSKFLCMYDDEGYLIFTSNILPLIFTLLEDGEAEVRRSSCISLVNVSTLIRNEDLGQQLLTVILRLAHEDDKAEMRMIATELLNSSAEVLGLDLCKQFVIPEIVSLSEDPVFRVRKTAALNLYNICKVGGEEELFERLMPAFVRLSKDDMFQVRRACAESLSDISNYVNDDIRVGVLVEIFLRLMHDLSKPVKHCALLQSGRFISSLPSRGINAVILDVYCSLATDPTNEPAFDAELKHNCAFCFAGVFQAVGVSRWSELKPVYQSLIQSGVVTVKQTLAHSLHEMANIFGNETLIEEELVPVFEEMIQDVEPVQLGIMKYLASFLRMLSEPVRVSYLPLLHDILHSTNPFNWRLRECLAVQLPELVLLPPLESLFDSLFPLVMTLLQDPVSCVRKNSYQGVTTMIALLAGSVNLHSHEIKENTQHFKSVIATINSLIRGDTYQMRQLWLELCHCILYSLPEDIIIANFIPGIVQLAADPVINVRITVAALLTGWETYFNPSVINECSNCDNTGRNSNWSWLLRRSDIQNCVKSLAQDEQDVYDKMVRLKDVFPGIEFKVAARVNTVNPELELNLDDIAEADISLNLTSMGTPVDIARDLSSPSRMHSYAEWDPTQMIDGVPNDYSLDKIDGLPDEILGRNFTEQQTFFNRRTDSNNDRDDDEEDSKIVIETPHQVVIR